MVKGRASKVDFHVKRAWDGIRAIGWDFAKSQLPVQTNRGLHFRLNRVEPQLLVSHAARLGDDPLRQLPAEAAAAKLRSNVKAFHLRYPGRKLVQRHAACGLGQEKGDHESAIRGAVVAGKISELAIEILEAQAEAERPRVFEKQFTHPAHLLWGMCAAEIKISGRPPLTNGR